MNKILSPPLHPLLQYSALAWAHPVSIWSVLADFSSILYLLFSVATEYSQESGNFYFPEGYKHVTNIILYCLLHLSLFEKKLKGKLWKSCVYDEHVGAAPGFLFY